MAYNLPSFSVLQVASSNHQVFHPRRPQRYCIAELLLLEKILPYTICPRDAFHFNAYLYKLVHIPGLANESTNNAARDQNILTDAFRREFNARDKIRSKGYRYIMQLKNPADSLRVKALCVEIRAACVGGGSTRRNYRTALKPASFDLLVDRGPLKVDGHVQAVPPDVPISSNSSKENVSSQASKMVLDGPPSDTKLSKTPSDHSALKVNTNVTNIGVEGYVNTHNADEKKGSSALKNKWGGDYGYTVPSARDENVKPSQSLLRSTSTGQDQLAWIKFMLHKPLAPQLTTTNVVKTPTEKHDDNPFSTIGTSLREALNEDLGSLSL